MGVELERARAAQDRLADLVAEVPAVSGVGIERTPDGYELKVSVLHEDAEDDVPAEVDGVPVRVDTVGPVRKRHG